MNASSLPSVEIPVQTSGLNPTSSIQHPASVVKNGMTLRRRRNDDKYHVRIRFRGKVHFVTLSETITESARLALLARKEIHAGRWTDFKAKTQLRADVPQTKLAAVEMAYRRFHGQASAKSKARNLQALHRILTLCDLDPLHATLAALTGELIWTWTQKILARANAPGIDPERSIQLRRSANSELVQARAVFAPDCLQYYRREAKLEIPDTLATFRTEPGFKKVSKDDYHAPPDVIIAATFQALDALAAVGPGGPRPPGNDRMAESDLNLYKACWLAIGFGLRAGEIRKARNSDFQRIGGDTFFRPDWRSKNKREIEIGVQLDAWQRLGPCIEGKPAGDFVIAGDPGERGWKLFRRISAWMQALGWQTTHQLHELRAWAGCQIASNHPQGMLAAQAFMRHSSVVTTQKYYGHHIKVRLDKVQLTLPTIQPFEPVIIPAAAG